MTSARVSCYCGSVCEATLRQLESHEFQVRWNCLEECDEDESLITKVVPVGCAILRFAISRGDVVKVSDINRDIEEQGSED